MKTKKYIVWPGYVTSKLDGDRHYISASQLMHLHGVQISECVIIRGPEDHYKLRRIHKDLIDLSPREDGKYKSYGQPPEQIANADVIKRQHEQANVLLCK